MWRCLPDASRAAQTPAGSEGKCAHQDEKLGDSPAASAVPKTHRGDLCTLEKGYRHLRLEVRSQLWGRSLGLSTDLPYLLLVVRAKLETQTLEPASPLPPWRELPNA